MGSSMGRETYRQGTLHTTSGPFPRGRAAHAQRLSCLMRPPHTHLLPACREALDGGAQVAVLLLQALGSCCRHHNVLQVPGLKVGQQWGREV